MSARTGLCLALSAWLAFLPVPAAADYGFRIQRAEIRPGPEEGLLLLDADIDYRFSEPAIDALRNGVTLTMVWRVGIEEEQGGWWNRAVLEESHSFRIRYHALSKLYQILGDPPHNFASMNAMLEAMEIVRGLPLEGRPALRKGARYRASLSVGLDIEALPLPLRPVAYVTPAWYLSSPVYRWTFEN